MLSLFPDICSEDPKRAAEFYAALLGLEVVFENGWYFQLRSPHDPAIQLAFVRRDHESVPPRWQVQAQGVFVTIEVEDADAVHRRAQELGLEIAYPLTDEAWGQRHFMVADPDGLPVDVVQLIGPALALAVPPKDR